MLQLRRSLQAWGHPEFLAILKEEIQALGRDHLPLQQGMQSASYVGDAAISVMIIDVSNTADSICVRAGVFYAGIIAGCNCADDPTPLDTLNEYCEVELHIDKRSAATTVRVAS